MNKNFDKFLAMLESMASTPERKADLHAARELYHKGALNEGIFDWLNGRHGSSAQLDQKRYGTEGHGKHGNAPKAPEIKERDDKLAEHINEIDANLSQASKLVVDAAEWNPGQVDAWVDYRLKPAIERTLKDDSGFLTSEEKNAAYKSEKARFEKIYKNADKSDKKVWEDRMSDALKKADEDEAYRKEEEQVKEAESQRQKDRDLAKAGEEKRAKADPNSTVRGWDATQSVGATEQDINERAAENSSKGFEERMAKEKEEAGKQAEEAQKKEADRQKAESDKAEQSRLGDLADNIDWSMFGTTESVADKNLRAAFESVYGDSRGYTDREIRVICESCYRRAKK